MQFRRTLGRTHPVRCPSATSPKVRRNRVVSPLVLSGINRPRASMLGHDLVGAGRSRRVVGRPGISRLTGHDVAGNCEPPVAAAAIRGQRPALGPLAELAFTVLPERPALLTRDPVHLPQRALRTSASPLVAEPGSRPFASRVALPPAGLLPGPLDNRAEVAGAVQMRLVTGALCTRIRIRGHGNRHEGSTRDDYRDRASEDAAPFVVYRTRSRSRSRGA